MNPAQYGRNGDNTMVHMNNREVAGLEALARANGTNLTINPTTGYPEAFNILPTLAGIAGGAIAGPWGAALASGATTAATTGSLEQGLLAGVTAGAMGGIGNELAATGAEAAGQGMMDQAAADFVAADAQALADAGISGAQAADALNVAHGAEMAGSGIDATSFINQPPPVTEMSSMTNPNPQNFVPAPGYGQTTTPQWNVTTPDMAKVNAPLTPSKYGQMYEGGKSLLSDSSGKKLGEFVSSQKIPLATAAAGTAGQAQYAAAQEMEGKKQAMDREKAAKLKATQDVIRRNYANVGRALPTNPYTGQPVFAGGGLIGLVEGGRPYDNQQFEDEYAAAMSQEPWYRSLPADMVEGIFGIKDPYVLNKILEAKRARAREMQSEDYAAGGAVRPFDSAPRYLETGGMLGDGMSDDIPAMIDGDQPAALSDGEFVVPADVVSHLGNGSSDAGAQQLYAMMDRIRQARTGNKEQGKEINPKKMMPA